MQFRALQRGRTRIIRTQSSEASSPHPTTGINAHSPGSRAMLLGDAPRGKQGVPLPPPAASCRERACVSRPRGRGRSRGQFCTWLSKSPFYSHFITGLLSPFTILCGSANGVRSPRADEWGGRGRRGALQNATLERTARAEHRREALDFEIAETGAQVCSPPHHSSDRSFMEARWS